MTDYQYRIDQLSRDYDLPTWKVKELYAFYKDEELYEKLEECLGKYWEDDE